MLNKTVNNENKNLEESHVPNYLLYSVFRTECAHKLTVNSRRKINREPKMPC